MCKTAVPLRADSYFSLQRTGLININILKNEGLLNASEGLGDTRALVNENPSVQMT